MLIYNNKVISTVILTSNAKSAALPPVTTHNAGDKSIPIGSTLFIASVLILFQMKLFMILFE